jgi:hypothetical protein
MSCHLLECRPGLDEDEDAEDDATNHDDQGQRQGAQMLELPHEYRRERPDGDGGHDEQSTELFGKALLHADWPICKIVASRPGAPIRAQPEWLNS